MNTFAGITEGKTDQIIIKNILAGYFNPDITINWLQPLEDETDANRSSNFGGWDLVFKYCESDEFKEAFQLNQYIIIQIDTDVSDEYYGVPHQDKNGEFSAEKIIELAIDKLKAVIGEEFYSKYHERIIFAIAVHSTECWLLPLYYDDKRKSKLVNCLDTLNQEIRTKEGFTIDPKNKNPEYYRHISRKFSKHKVLIDKYQYNPSFKIFIEEIQKRNIILEEID
jgi:hypothetical protein